MTPRESDEAVLAEIALKPMTWLQIRTVALCLLVIVIEGYDALAMAFTAAGVSADWSLGPDRLGILLSSSLAGMGAGALLLSPAADRFGRRATIIGCLVLVTIGMTVSGLSPDVPVLAGSRFLTGAGVGAMISSSSALIYEYCSDRGRGLGMGGVSMGFPAGAILGGAVTIILLESHGWRAVFFCGAAASAVTLILFLAFVPESLSFLLCSDRPGSRPAAHRLAARLKLTARPAPGPVRRADTPRSGIMTTLGPRLRRRTVRLSAMFALIWISFFYIVSWVPKLAQQAGHPASEALFAGVMMNCGGVVGGPLIGLLAGRFGLVAVTRTMIVLMAAGVALFGATASSGAIQGVAALLGAVSYGVMACIYLLLSTVYPTEIRATAIGIVQTAGRVGAAAGPFLGGLLLAQGWSIPLVSLVLAVPAVAGAMLVSIDRQRA